MAVGSRSSLRRSGLRGQSSDSQPRSSPRSSLIASDSHKTHLRPQSDSRSLPQAPPLLTQSRDAGNILPSKRLRASTISDKDHIFKRRRLSNPRDDAPQLHIPLRSRVPKFNPPAPASVVPQPEISTLTPTTSISTPIASPSGKPQYEQIKIIEAKAKAAIRNKAVTSTQDEKRKLRSEDGGSRAKTELAQYFPEFEEMLSLKAPDPDSITTRTHVVLLDDTPDFEPRPPKADPFGANKPLYLTDTIQFSRRGTITDLAAPDPLHEDYYLKIHAKAERHEKQMKNGDRERAQHEKYQLEKLLEDLRGPDWLKTLGITGVTDSEKKRYEPKRTLFIREIQALIEKFRRWKEEEKRRKLEREQALLEEEMKTEEQEEEGEEEQKGRRNSKADRGRSSSEDTAESMDSTSSQAPNSSELDALASQQLIEEAESARRRKKLATKTVEQTGPPPLPPPPAPPKPFTSFFEKKHLRDAAVAGRQRGRIILAFGVPVPELAEHEFELPSEILTEDAIRRSQRSRRRQRRRDDE
ncbi:hypothetical protein B0A52_05678 [Exophiala mesophila]|uniref:Something about silencing protein 4 domain-containing protein n=1 Tax=Exophiala mesophila TaxID=212818 RepID=A0A438N2Q7_EXOME|nr:hypothetical protein B0A52_05678 [Exophiala mesophila]